MAVIATLSIFSLLLFIVFPFLLHIIVCIWSYRDALHRGHSKEYALIVLVAILIFPVIGFIVYLIIRSD